MKRWLFVLLALTACDPTSVAEDASGQDASADAGVVEPEPLSTAHCTYAPLPATAGAGGRVEAGPVTAGVAEVELGLPVGAALGGNTSRAAPLDNQGDVDGREVPLSGTFTPSVGVETIPKVKALAITAGGETVLLLRSDTIFSDDTVTHEVTEALGPELAGKVIWLSSHTHTAPEQYSADTKFQVGGGPVRASVRAALIERLIEAGRAALDARVPARIGVASDHDFDPEDRVSYDRRPENDDLYHGGEARKDTHLAVIRVDTLDGAPMAILPVFGAHSAILDDDVAVFSTDLSGMIERTLEEQFDAPVMVMHLQGAAGDVLGASHGHLEYEEGQLRWDFARNEENGRWALPQILPVWEAAGEVMQDRVAMEVVTRSVPMGPDWRTFTVRDGALAYAPWDGRRPADREVWRDGAIVSPIDEFNAPGGASLCGEDTALLDIAQLPNVDGLTAYHSCASLERATMILGILLDFEFEPTPLCVSTRTTITAWRLGDHLFATAPGEPLVPWAEYVRERSPLGAENTFVLGYAQGHNGYLLRPEDWLQGGFEPTINSWGPLEGEYLAERLAELMALAVTDAREDAAAGGVDRVVAMTFDDGITPTPDVAPDAGTVPDAVPGEVFFRGGYAVSSAQPAATVERVNEVARFVWLGEDSLVGTPRVTLQREVDGVFEAVTRRSGRPVEDLDLIVVWTPQPLTWEPGEARTHYWTVEWQPVSWRLEAPLDERAGVPLGRYRFHVEGSGYALDSEPFEVVPATLDVRTRTEGEALVVEALFQPREGWRLMDMTGRANRDVGDRAGPFEVEVRGEGGASETFTGVEPEAPGVVRVTPSFPVTSVRVRDRFGNAGEVSG